MSVSVGGLVTSYNNAADNNYDTPTNPLITKSSSAGDRLFTVILHDNNSANTVISEPISGSGLHTQYSKIEGACDREKLVQALRNSAVFKCFILLSNTC